MVGRPRQLGPQGIEPRSVVPETTVLSVELQARVRSRLLLGALTPCVEACACALAGFSLASIAAESRLEWNPVFSRRVVRKVVGLKEGRRGPRTSKRHHWWFKHAQEPLMEGDPRLVTATIAVSKASPVTSAIQAGSPRATGT